MMTTNHSLLLITSHANKFPQLMITKTKNIREQTMVISLFTAECSVMKIKE